MAEKLKLVQGDTLPQPKAVITDSTSGLPVNLAGGSALMYFRKVGASALLATVPGVLLTGLEADDGSVSTAAPYNVAGYGGRVAFVWSATDLNVPAGDYEGELQITFADGGVQSVYEFMKFKVRAQMS
jgi:hypothetical protein